MKKWARLLCCTLSIVFVFAMLASCNKSDTQTNGDKTTKEDLSGETYNFRGSFIPKNSRDYTDEENASRKDEQYSLEQETMMKKVVETENALNCKIVCYDGTDGMSWMGGDIAEFAASVASGETPSDIIYGEIRSGRELYIGGFMADLGSIKALDLSDTAKWGSADAQSTTSYKGTVWGFPCIGSNYYPYPKMFNGIMLVKEDQYKSYNLDTTPKELDEAKQWTFEKFSEILPKVSNTDTNNKKYGFSGSASMVYNCAVLNNGGNRVIKDDTTGKYVYGWTQKNAISAIDWARNITSNKDIFNDGNDYQGFVDGKFTFLLTNGYRWSQEISEKGENYSWVPFPYGPDVKYGTTYASYQETGSESFIGIVNVLGDDRAQKTGIVMDNLFGQVSMPGYDSYSDYLYRNYFNDGDTYSFDIYKNLSTNYTSSYELDMGTAYKQFTGVLTNLVTSTNATDALVSQVEGLINQQLDIEMNSGK